MINDIKVEDTDNIEAMDVLGKIDLLIENVLLTMNRVSAKKLHEVLEKVLYDPDSWNVNLTKKVEQLEQRIHFLEEV
jgi:hypothetical protein